MLTLSDLNHVHHQTPSGANVYVLDTGAIIDSEAEAMLQALHSRSTGGFLSHLEILKEKGAENFMSKFYVGYGHKSIGDCGSLTVFVEGISMLAAKALQDTKLYNGQESSTRYIDFSQQKLVNVLGTPEGERLLEDQRSYYLSLIEPIKECLSQMYPIKEGVPRSTYRKTIAAKAFDITRGFLPAGCSTNLARHTTLRQMADRILFLRNHPLPEVQEIAQTLLDAVLEKYPNSFSAKTYKETEDYVSKQAEKYYYHDTKTTDLSLYHNGINLKELEKHRETIESRPNAKTEFPAWIDNIGTCTYRYLLDFGSFRDVQRHRAPFQRMPLLTTELGFHKRYLESLPESLRNKTLEHLENTQNSITEFGIDETLAQYYVPMGYQMSCEMMGTLPALAYMTELRSTTYVHPTLREIAIGMGVSLEENFALKLFLDRSDDDFDTRRGTQDIQVKT